MSVYPGIDIYSRNCVKLKILTGIDIRLIGSQILSIDYNRAFVSGYSVRLSDFCTSCASSILDCNQPRSYPFIEFVVDDKISVKENTFSKFPCLGARIDLRSFSSDVLMEQVVKDLEDFLYCFDELSDYVLDKDHRIDYYKAVYLIESRTTSVAFAHSISDVVSDSKHTNEQMVTKYRDSFIAVSKAEFERYNFGINSHSFATWLATPEAVDILASHDYDRIRSSMYILVFEEMAHTVDYKLIPLLKRFRNYIKLFEAPPDIQNLFISMCKRWRKWFIKYAKKNRW